MDYKENEPKHPGILETKEYLKIYNLNASGFPRVKVPYNIRIISLKVGIGCKIATYRGGTV